MHHRFLQVGDERHRRAVAARALHSIGGDEVEPHLLGLGRLLLAAREVDQLGDQRRHLAQLLDDVLQQPLALTRRQPPVAREDLHVRAEARQRRAQLVRRVGNKLALGARRLLESPEHRVEARREPAELVAPRRLDALRQVAGLRNGLRRSGQAADGCERGPRDAEAERRGDRDPCTPDQDQVVLDPTERLVDLRERSRDLDREPRRIRKRDDADVRVVHVRVHQECSASVARDVLDPVVDG